MPFQRALLILLCASVALAADAPELRPVKGDKIKGDLIEINDKDIVLKVNGNPVATSIEGTLALDFRAPVDPSGTFSQVELIDGSILRCPKVAFKKKDVILTLFSGETVTVPLTQLTTILHEANDVKLLASWKELFENKQNFDLAVGKKEDGSLGYFKGTFYDADDEGKTIEFKEKNKENARTFTLTKLIGLYFNRQPDANMPSRKCEVIDLQGAKLYAKNVTFKDGKFVVETQCGTRITYTPDTLAKLDYNRGKLTYLSDLDLTKVDVKQESLQGEKEKPNFYRDRNPDGGANRIRLQGKTYDKGFGVHSKTIATFNLEGEYREFQAVVGIDDNVGQGLEDPVIVRVEADGKELKSLRVTRKDGAQPIQLSIKDVQKLRIIVDSPPDNYTGLGGHVDIADARVSK